MDTSNDILAARLDVLSMALQCIARSLAPSHTDAAAAALRAGLSDLVAERHTLSEDEDEAIAVQAGVLLKALSG